MPKYIVKNFMSQFPVGVTTSTSLDQVLSIMYQKNIRHLPVVDENQVPINIITDRDIRLAMDSPFHKQLASETLINLSSHTVAELNTVELKTVHANTSLVEAAEIMLEHRIGGLPVVDEQGKLAGMITETDLVKCLRELLAAQE